MSWFGSWSSRFALICTAHQNMHILQCDCCIMFDISEKEVWNAEYYGRLNWYWFCVSLSHYSSELWKKTQYDSLCNGLNRFDGIAHYLVQTSINLFLAHACWWRGQWIPPRHFSSTFQHPFVLVNWSPELEKVSIPWARFPCVWDRRVGCRWPLDLILVWYTHAHVPLILFFPYNAKIVTNKMDLCPHLLMTVNRVRSFIAVPHQLMATY